MLLALCIISLPLVNINWSYSPETPNSGQNRRFYVPCDLEIWQIILKNNMVPLLCYFKLCASFRSHLWIQTGVTVRKRPNCGKIGFDLCDLDLWPLTLTFCMDISLSMVTTPENFMLIQWQEHCEKGVTNGQTVRTDGRTDGQCS